MGLFDLFTGAPAIEAAEKNRALLQQTQGNVANRTNTAAGTAADYLKTGFGDARANLGQGYGASTGAVNQGAVGAQGSINQGQTDAFGQLLQARGDLTAGGGAYAPLSALAQRYGQGGQLYGDSLGLGGAEGNQRAQQAFQAGPGYNFALDQGIDSLNRRANAGGMLQGGNANRDAITFAQGLANQEYGNWQNRLKGIGDQELQATAGAAAGNQANNTTLAGLGVTGAGLMNTGGQNRAAIATGQGGSLADLARQFYGGQAGLDTQQGGALAGNTMGAAGQINSADLNLAPQVGKTFQDEAQASLTGTKNLWGLGMAGAQLAMGMPPTSLGSLGGGSPGGSNAFIPSQSFMNNSWGY